MVENSFKEDWQRIKELALRLQTVTSLLTFFESRLNEINSIKQFTPVQQQLIIDFEETLQTLIELVEKYDF